MAKVGRWPLGLLAACAVLGAVRRLEGQTRVVSEYEVKAAFLYNFAKFIEWPTDPTAPGPDVFVISILGEDPFGTTLDDLLRGKMIGPRRVVVRRVPRGQDVGPSHIVFISDSESQRLPALLKHFEGVPVLTVSDADGFAEHGGVVRLRMERSRVRLDINLAAAERAHLKISSELLKLARIVEGGAAG
jgi:uncharacterized protein DUF4154